MAKTVHKIIKNTQNNEVIIRWDIFQYLSHFVLTPLLVLFTFFSIFEFI